MTKRMLIDATHNEETRVAVVDGNRLVDFDYESTVRKQLKGSIFLAKVTRVEPSLQAAFVNFGGNRHGFLPFSEIHPDYFRIPIADREALIAEQQAELEAMEAAEEEAMEAAEEAEIDTSEESTESADDSSLEDAAELESDADDADDTDDEEDDTAEEEASDDDSETADEEEEGNRRNYRRGRGRRGRGRGRTRAAADSRKVEIVGGDGIEGDRPVRPSLKKNDKIQEVVKRGQIMLIQASKEERGNKGAAVTSYLSLPGRYCVLMPNSPRGGGVSRKIANYKDRKRMREILSELNVPQGMSVIMRTAGVERSKAEIKRDCDYLLRLWNNIRELTLESTAPATVHEEGHLIRRSIRDIYAKDIEEVLVAGEEGYKTARDFMKMMIPSHAKRVKLYEDQKAPLFQRYQVESQIAGMGEPNAQMKSGGYLVINPTEALVSVDVNSGRATKERHIEETALKTNLEAADEVARQLRLRDLGGLVVIDFIDMEERRNNRKVEQRLKEALSTDRARIQIGRISSFGLLELSRQRLNPSLTESQFQQCPHCKGLGYVRTVDSAAITALRALEEEGIKGKATEVALHIPNDIALYILNNKREMLADIEQRYGFSVLIKIDDNLAPAGVRIEALKKSGGKDEASEDESERERTQDGNSNANDEEDGKNRSRRRRGRRGGRRRNNRNENENENGDDSTLEENNPEEITVGAESESEAEEKPKRGRRKPAKKKGEDSSVEETADESKAEEKTEEKAAEKPKRGRKKKTDDAQTDETPAAKEEEKPKTKKRSPAKKAAKKDDEKSDQSAKPEPSNDTAPPAAKEYETVNEAPTKKKKGWWNKLTD